MPMHTKAFVDGFELLIGSINLHIVCSLTIILALRPPQYENDQRTKEALVTYFSLIAFHLIQGVIRYCTIFVTNRLRPFIAIFMMFPVVFTMYLSQRWVYAGKNVLELETELQRQFYVWCSLEIAIFWITIIASAIFTLVRSAFKTQLRVQGPLTEERNEDTDVLIAESLLIEMFTLILAPIGISRMVDQYCYDEMDGEMYQISAQQKVSNVLSFIQALLFCFFVFTPRGSVFKTKWWNENIPDYCYLAVQVSIFWIPPAIVAINFMILAAEGEQVVQVAVLILQIVLHLSFRL